METKAASTHIEEKQSFIACQSSQGVDIRGSILRLTRHSVVFEICAPSVLLQMSEVLNDFKIILGDRVVFSGRVAISSLVNAGEILICEVNLADHWLIVEPLSRNGDNQLSGKFNQFLQDWQKTYKVVPEFKVVVADMQSLLADMRLWLDQIELSVRSAPSGERGKVEKEVAEELATPVLSAIDSLGDRFEEIASRLDPDLRPVHIHFARRNLHSLLLCSPFGYRTFHKPLGYAGDYEMVNMIVGQPYEGPSLFAKVVNAWFLNQLPAQGHRNRIKYLKAKLLEELAVKASQGRQTRILNLGCGPASEIQQLLAESELSEMAQFTLLDFNEETIQYTSRILQDTCKRYRRNPSVQVLKKSAQQLIKEASKPGGSPAEGKYDLVYCAGLFDYLPDRVCKQLMGVFYHWLAPGGLLLITAVDGTRPFRNKLEFILDWNLLYRTGQQLSILRPDPAPPENCLVQSDWTAVNLFLEIRKPSNA
jgi:extracellular factor (EF) 3-hydroxypalmitic acid methyl ester biosynthesis protein